MLRNTNQDIIHAIVIGNLNKIKTLVKKNNVNNILDDDNKFTPILYAVSHPYQSIIKYLLSLDADYTVKDSDGRSIFDISIGSNKKLLFEIITTNLDNRLDIISEELKEMRANNNLQRKLLDEKKVQIAYIDKVVDDTNKELTKLEHKYDDLEHKYNDLEHNYKNQVKISDERLVEVEKYKKRNLEAEKAFENVLKKQRKN